MENHHNYPKGVHGSQSQYSKAQWDWLFARYKEGYRLKELAALIHRHENTVINQFQRRGYVRGCDLPPIETRRAEFEALADS